MGKGFQTGQTREERVLLKRGHSHPGHYRRTREVEAILKLKHLVKDKGASLA